jgi:hypothetical protein
MVVTKINANTTFKVAFVVTSLVDRLVALGSESPSARSKLPSQCQGSGSRQRLVLELTPPAATYPQRNGFDVKLAMNDVDHRWFCVGPGMRRRTTGQRVVSAV